MQKRKKNNIKNKIKEEHKIKNLVENQNLI